MGPRRDPDLSELDLLIVGAGPTGLTLAVEAARHGLSFRIVDRTEEPSRHSKALAVQPRTLEVFEDLGVGRQALDAGFPVSAITVYAGSHPIARLSFDGLDSPFPTILILEQSETERLLIGRLEELVGRVERRVELTSFVAKADAVAGTLRGPGRGEETVRCRWLAGCDGAHSVVRHGLGLPFEGAAYEEDFVLGDVRIDWDLIDDEGFGFVRAGDVLLAVPMRGERRYRLIATLPGTPRRGVGPRVVGSDPTLEEMQALLDAAAPVSGRVSDPVWLANFRLHRRIVPRLSVGRVFLLGDAAHIHSPVGGQGMNTGIQDAYNLGWKLGLVATGVASPVLLESYDAERRPVAEGVVRFTDFAFRTLLGNSPAMRLVRRTVPRLLFGNESIRRRALRIVSQVGIEYRGSPIVLDGPGRFRGGPQPGDRAPDGVLYRGPGRVEGPSGAAPQVAEGRIGPAVRLFELTRGPRHALLAFAGGAASRRTAELVGAAGAAVAERVPVAVFVIAARPDPPELPDWPGAVLLDPTGEVHGRYGARVPSIYLIRPDGHVGYRGAAEHYEPFLAYLSRMLVGGSQEPMREAPR